MRSSKDCFLTMRLLNHTIRGFVHILDVRQWFSAQKKDRSKFNAKVAKEMYVSAAKFHGTKVSLANKHWIKSTKDGPQTSELTSVLSAKCQSRRTKDVIIWLVLNVATIGVGYADYLWNIGFTLSLKTHSVVCMLLKLTQLPFSSSWSIFLVLSWYQQDSFCFLS